MKPHRLIWFSSTEYIAEHPDCLKKLRDIAGLTTIMPESHVCHTSGFRASDEIAERGPFKDWRDREDLWPKAKEGVYPVVAGTVGGFDDTPLLKTIEAARAAGLEIWGHLGLWSYGGEVYPEFSMQDVDGQPLDRKYQAWGIGLCPSRQEINEWTCDCLVDVLERYDIDGFCVDHARFPAPANISSLFACACECCRDQAQTMGFHFEAMKHALLDLRARLEAASADDLQAIVRTGLPEGIRDWLDFRARLLAGRMCEFRAAVRQAGGEDKVFGSDVWPPSAALIGGHDYTEWERGADFLTGGSTAGGVVGWATVVTNLATEWAPYLCARISDLDEATALKTVFRLFGYDQFSLPDSVNGIKNGPLPIPDIFAHEVERLAASGSSLPMYPPVSATGSPERVRSLCETVKANNCQGAMLGLDPGDDENLQVIGEILGRGAR